MIGKLLHIAEKAWRHLKESELLQEVYAGQQFADGISDFATLNWPTPDS